MCFPILDLTGVKFPVAKEEGDAPPPVKDIATPEASLAPNSNP